MLASSAHSFTMFAEGEMPCGCKSDQCMSLCHHCMRQCRALNKYRQALDACLAPSTDLHPSCASGIDCIPGSFVVAQAEVNVVNSHSLHGRACRAMWAYSWLALLPKAGFPLEFLHTLEVCTT